VRNIGLALTCFLAGCASTALQLPYPPSSFIGSIDWDFSSVITHRKALGSDLWPCAWAVDGDLYCAWGDGGGFDGNDDNVGRVSLGFARITGIPSSNDPAAYSGRNIWGSTPYARFDATFGGKVGSMTAVNGVLYASGGFWTPDNNPEPTRKSGRGPLTTIAWSTDFAQSWSIAPWSLPQPLGSFLDMGQDSMTTAPAYLYLYYLRGNDTQHLFLKRIRPELLTQDPATAHNVEYFTRATQRGRAAHWSHQEADARPVFSDKNHVEGPCVVYDSSFDRYLLTAGHYRSSDDNDSSAGQVGMFESRHPWGPWSTIGYYDNWGGIKTETSGDFLSLRVPSKWISPDGKSFWAVFSGLKSFDSFNVVRGSLLLR
jgi:hypothetical protein